MWRSAGLASAASSPFFRDDDARPPLRFRGEGAKPLPDPLDDEARNDAART